jgi:hypothetical protein
MKSKEEQTREAISLVKMHLEIWGETNVAKRVELIKKVYADNIQVIDPEIILNGWVETADFIGGLLKQHPGFKFMAAGPIETHHNSAVLCWQFGPESKPDTITGQDIFTLSNGKIVSLLVFVDGVTRQVN